MKLKLFLSIVYLISSIVLARNIDSLKTSDSYNNKGLQLLLFCGNEKFVSDWSKPQTPQIQPIQSISKGGMVIPIIIFGSNSDYSKKNSNLIYNIKIINPDGTIYGDYKNLLIWNDKSDQNLHLLKQYLKIYIEKKDQFGLYKIKVKVIDKVKDIIIPLSIKFKVKKDGNKTEYTIKSIKDYSNLIQNYYSMNYKNKIDTLLKYSIDKNILLNEKSKNNLEVFFGVLFNNADSKKINKWKEYAIKKDTSYIKIFNDIFYISKSPQKLLSSYSLSPGLNDYLWSAFYASGNYYYINQIIKHLSLYDNRVDMNLFFTGATALWSLSSNLRQNEEIKAYLNNHKDNYDSTTVLKINEAIKTKPNIIQEEMVKIVKKQKSKKVWK